MPLLMLTTPHCIGDTEALALFGGLWHAALVAASGISALRFRNSIQVTLKGIKLPIIIIAENFAWDGKPHLSTLEY